MALESERSVLRRTVITQSIIMCLSVAGMVILVVGQPHIIRAALSAVFDSGYARSAVSESALQYFYTWGILAVVFFFAGNEIAGYSITKKFRYVPGTNTGIDRFQRLIAERATAAGMSAPELVVIPTKYRLLNAAAMASIFSGQKIMIVGEIVETLTDKEEAYVVAHELRHLRHRDVFQRSLITAGNGALSIQKWSLLALVIYQAFLVGPSEVMQLGVAWAVLTLSHAAYELLSAADSRAREYLADAGAVTDVGWADREHLIIGMVRIHHAMTGRGPLLILGVPEEWKHSHPSTLNRARAIGVDPMITSAGNLLLDDTVIRLT